MAARIPVTVIFDRGSYVRYFSHRFEIDDFYRLVVKRPGFLAIAFE